jgi:hypothetical protein
LPVSFFLSMEAPPILDTGWLAFLAAGLVASVAGCAGFLYIIAVIV